MNGPMSVGAQAAISGTGAMIVTSGTISVAGGATLALSPILDCAFSAKPRDVGTAADQIS